MIGHLGSRVSALLDGRLCAAEEEKAWEHVHACHLCRDMVEREGWVKTQLATLRPASCAVSDGFKSSLLAASFAVSAPEPEPGFVHRHRGVVVFGSSAAGVAIVGMAALSGVFGAGTVTDRRPTMTTIEQPVEAITSSPAARGTQAPSPSPSPSGTPTVVPTPALGVHATHSVSR